MTIHVAILLAVIAAVGFNVAIVIQKVAADRLPKLTFPPRPAQIAGFFTNGPWMAAFALMVASWGCYLVALAHAPVSIVQPLLGLGLAVLAVFSVFKLRERLGGGEWLGIGVMVGGLVMLGASAETHESGALVLPDYPRLIALALALYGLLGLTWLVERFRAGTFNLELILGAASGLVLGTAALFTRAMLIELRIGDPWTFRGLLVLVIALNLAGIFTQQGGFQRGRAMTVTTVLAVLNKVVAVTGGFLALGEGLPEDPLMRGLRIGALVLLLLGTALLARFNEHKSEAS